MAESLETLLLKEYLEHWKAYGVEDTALSPMQAFDGLNRRARQAKKIPAHAEEPIPGQIRSLEDIAQWLGDCQRCGLCATRKKIVFGAGTNHSRLLFVGEGPGADEDESGEPFVGKAGALLTKIIEAMGMTRDQVYIANIVKCRPPGNRVPNPEEVEKCLPFLKAQINVLQPQMIVALGLTAAIHLTGQVATMGALRGRFQKLPWNPEIEVLPTYHPAYLLRNPESKQVVWEDLKQVLKKLEKVS